MDAQQEMNVIAGEPVEITLFGQPRKVLKMTIAQQQEAIRLFEGMASDQVASPSEKMFAIMPKIVALAAGLPVEEIESKSDLAEIAVAFSAVFKQNKFAFLLAAMADVTRALSGATGSS